jgi:hypothetical protein
MPLLDCHRDLTHYISALGYMLFGIFVTLAMFYGFRVDGNTTSSNWICVLFSFFSLSVLMMTYLSVRHYRLKRAADSNFIMGEV